MSHPFDFKVHFGSEEFCRLHFKQQRDQQGITCKKCGSKDHYWLQNKWSYECKSCKFRTSLRSGTLMQSSKLSFLVWYRTLFLMNLCTKQSTPREVQLHLGLKRYEPVWVMVNRLREVIKTDDKKITLEEMVTANADFFTINVEKVLHENRSKRAVRKKDKIPFAIFTASAFDTTQTDDDNFTDEANEFLTTPQKNDTYLDISKYIQIKDMSLNLKGLRPVKELQFSISHPKDNPPLKLEGISKKELQICLNTFIYKLNKKIVEMEMCKKTLLPVITNF